jgi:pimeloyl-ACP methyl ester carboxylesterase
MARGAVDECRAEHCDSQRYAGRRLDRTETPQLDEIQASLDAGDLDRARRVLLQVEGQEKTLLVDELGEDAFERARSAAAAGGRRGKLGKVLLLPGIMGSELDSIDAKGDADRIWLKYLALIRGRIEELELAADGSPASRKLQVRPAGVHRKTYLSMLLELDTRWHVRPFPFDWRDDIDKSADRLAQEIETFTNGDPVHLLAHSMGGLVSRRFIQRHRELWRSIDDSTGQGRGGRLVMLGTPNHGSFAIPLTLSGAEKVVKLLARADLHHNLQELLAIVGSFPGLYQMLPSPLVDLNEDHHRRLFDFETWGPLPARAPLLIRAQAFIRDLQEVIDPHRLVYVAGYNQRTPSEIRVDRPGKFSYRETYDGDGRVPHTLGLLDGVDTYWVFEIHGSLAKNGLVLDSITELLQRGTTSHLPAVKPVEPPPSRAARRGWVPGDRIEPIDPAIDSILADARTRGAATGEPEPTPEEAVELTDLAIAEYLGRGDAEPASPTAVPAAEITPLPLRIEVHWGDVTRVEGDVYTVGHYQGVEPQRAELALDEVVSGIKANEESYDRRRLVITQHTRRGMLRGAVGDVSFFPWGDTDHDSGKVVAVAGMGRPGTFDRTALRRVARSLILAIGALPTATTVCTVLIGSGEGTLTITDAVRGLLDGIDEAAAEIAASDELAFVAPVDTLLIVERDLGRARQIDHALRAVARERRSHEAAGRHPPVALELSRSLKTARSGTVSVEDSVALVAESVLELAGRLPESPEQISLEPLLERIPSSQKVRNLVSAELRKAGEETVESSRKPRFRVESRPLEGSRADIAVRLSFWNDGRAIRAAAIHQAATVPERLITVDSGLVDDLVEKMTDPPAEEVDDLCKLLHRLLVPAEFREVLGSGPFIFEVDRPMARVHWEMLAGDLRDDGRPRPLAVAEPFARQIRTPYSPPPLPPRRPRDQLRALVIGDPGDPARRHDLPGARREALRVLELLEERGVKVEARIGAPGIPRSGPLGRVKPAERLDVLALLLEGGFDLLHYAGHGDFDPDDPRRAGWLFAGGLLTGSEIGRVEHVPTIVVANACLSAQTSQALAGERRAEDDRTEAGLLPSLADEFFRLGVRDYVGTAWEVNDIGAELFAEEFYEALLPLGGGRGASFGEAVRKARERLWERRRDFGPLWAAYQHYGDPTIDAGISAH